MPGLCGVSGPAPATAAVFDRLVRELAVGSRVRVESLAAPDGGWAIGRAHLGVLNPHAQLGAADAVHVLFHGDLHSVAELCALAGDETRDAGRRIAELYARHGDEFPRHLKGQFALAVLDQARGRLILVSDAVGSYPLYYCRRADGTFAFGPAVAPVVRALALKTSVDIEAVSSYLAFGFPFGARTLHEDVRLVPAAAVVSCDLRTGTVGELTYAQAADYFSGPRGRREDYVHEVVETFRHAVRRSVEGDCRIGLSLSGGLDSRAILSAVDGQAPRLTTCTVGVEGCADQAIAAQLATSAGTRHRFLPLGQEYLSAFLPQLRRMVALTDGMYLSHGLTEMLALGFFERADFAVLLRGHGGELLKSRLAWPFHTDAHTGRMSPREFVPYLLQRTDYVRRDLPIASLFAEPHRARAAAAPAATLERALDGVNLSADDLCTYVYLREHHRRFTVASLELFRHAVDVRLPFVDEDVLAAVFRGPSEWRRDTGLHRAVIAACAPQMLRVRNANTGAPAGAGPLVEALFDKMNTALRRLHVPGFRHYHAFDVWMKRMLLDSVEQVLLSPRCQDRGLWDAGTVRAAVDRTRGGIVDYGYLLQVMLNVELWLEECES